MLFLKPPFDLIDGVAVFSDHADERFFYYLPAMPHLTTEPDPNTGQPVPQLQLLKFRGGAGNGGLLTFEVDLGIADDVLDDVKAQLKSTHRLREDPVLAPVVLEGGSVELIILGAAWDDAGKPVLDEDGQQRFVRRQAHATKPALYGRNTAVFSVELDQEGVVLVEDSLVNSELLPIGVVYSLDFYALRPAFSVKVNADWNRVQTHLQESFSANVLFASVEIDKVVDKLVEDQVVNIEVDSFLPEGEDGGSWVGRRDQAVKEFKDMVLQNFFKPSIEPVKQEKDGWDKFTDTAVSLSNLAVTGGWGGIAKFSYVHQDLTRIDQKRANLQMSERVTVKRSIYPQATLKGLGRYLPRDANGQIDASRFIRGVDLDDPWFDKRGVQVHSLVDFEHDNVAAVTLTLTYDGRPQTIRLAKDTLQGTSAWNSLLHDGQMVREVAYQYRVAFSGVDTGERPGVLTGPVLTTIGDQFDVSPRGEGLYFIDDIQIGAATLQWARYPQVAVEVRYSDPAHGLRLAETFLLSSAHPEATWTRFRLDPALSAYDVRVTFLSPEGRDVLVDWTTTDQERLIVRDPHPLRRTVTVAAAVDWRLVAMVFVEMRYTDLGNGIQEEATLSFFDTDSDRAAKTFAVNIVDGEARMVNWTATFVLKDNRTIVVPASVTTGSTLVLRTDMAGHRVVTVAPPPVNFATAGIARVQAHLFYQDPAAGTSFEDDFTFISAADKGFFEYDYDDPGRSAYGATLRTIFANGLVQERDLGRLDVDRLVLPVT
ncbi:MAG: hypothetical protein ACOYEV_09555 [Candidatus Nanopelagicales bacterium]